MSHKMLGAHPRPPHTITGLVSKKPLGHDSSIYNREFRRELFRSADRIINRPLRPRP
jgi:hypothetical protein